MSKESKGATVQRPAFVKYFNDDIEIVQVNVPVDPGNNFVPHWQLHITYRGHDFKFQKEIGENSLKRPMYVEYVPGFEKEEEHVPSDAEKIAFLTSHCEHQHGQVTELVTQINDLKRIIIHLQRKDKKV